MPRGCFLCLLILVFVISPAVILVRFLSHFLFDRFVLDLSIDRRNNGGHAVFTRGG